MQYVDNAARGDRAWIPIAPQVRDAVVSLFMTVIQSGFYTGFTCHGLRGSYTLLSMILSIATTKVRLIIPYYAYIPDAWCVDNNEHILRLR